MMQMPSMPMSYPTGAGNMALQPVTNGGNQPFVMNLNGGGNNANTNTPPALYPTPPESMLVGPLSTNSSSNASNNSNGNSSNSANSNLLMPVPPNQQLQIYIQQQHQQQQQLASTTASTNNNSNQTQGSQMQFPPPFPVAPYQSNQGLMMNPYLNYFPQIPGADPLMNPYMAYNYPGFDSPFNQAFFSNQMIPGAVAYNANMDLPTTNGAPSAIPVLSKPSGHQLFNNKQNNEYNNGYGQKVYNGYRNKAAYYVNNQDYEDVNGSASSVPSERQLVNEVLDRIIQIELNQVRVGPQPRPPPGTNSMVPCMREVAKYIDEARAAMINLDHTLSVPNHRHQSPPSGKDGFNQELDHFIANLQSAITNLVRIKQVTQAPGAEGVRFPQPAFEELGCLHALLFYKPYNRTLSKQIEVFRREQMDSIVSVVASQLTLLATDYVKTLLDSSLLQQQQQFNKQLYRRFVGVCCSMLRAIFRKYRFSQVSVDSLFQLCSSLLTYSMLNRNPPYNSKEDCTPVFARLDQLGNELLSMRVIAPSRLLLATLKLVRLLSTKADAPSCETYIQMAKAYKDRRAEKGNGMAASRRAIVAVWLRVEAITKEMESEWKLVDQIDQLDEVLYELYRLFQIYSHAEHHIIPQNFNDVTFDPMRLLRNFTKAIANVKGQTILSNFGEIDRELDNMAMPVQVVRLFEYLKELGIERKVLLPNGPMAPNLAAVPEVPIVSNQVVGTLRAAPLIQPGNYNKKMQQQASIQTKIGQGPRSPSVAFVKQPQQHPPQQPPMQQQDAVVSTVQLVNREATPDLIGADWDTAANGHSTEEQMSNLRVSGRQSHHGSKSSVHAN